ncbi:nuclear transport factor 2 family protein [Belnapia sp. T6]|uniref:Nuclear transport factor 2 family protein n=1 Tax=Belnapia mucosa TaxID=2804532 RepID=A0ABS1UYQ6_9PROT|nr:nuclear transport factor 2 family protein [Belnapia mucosa]MBL6454591.1 nuclear transport factor 2 family protein [Belnapia mucosa]
MIGLEGDEEERMASTTIPTIDLLKAILAAFNSHDVDAVMAFFADDCVLEMPRGPDPWGSRHKGFVAVRTALQSRFDGIPDVHYADDQHYVAADTGMSKWTLRGTVAATGKSIEVRGCDFYEFRDGKVVRKDSYWKIVEPASMTG